MKKLKCNNQKGSTLVGALMAMMVLGFTGMAVVEMSTSANLSSVNDIQSNQAFYIGQAAIERAKDQLNNGLNPDVQNQAFGMGSFSIVSNPSGSSIQVTGQVGNARKVQTIGTNFSGSCVSLDLTEAYIEGNSLVNAKLIKFCNAAAIVTGMRVDWDFDSCETDVDAVTKCVSGTYGDYSSKDEGEDDDHTGEDDDHESDDHDGEDDDHSDDHGSYSGRSCSASASASSISATYTDYEDPDHEGKVLVCHVPPGNPGNAHTISISVDGWEHGHSKGHGRLHHEDYLGACTGYEGAVSYLDGDDDHDGEVDDHSDRDDHDGEDDHDDEGEVEAVVSETFTAEDTCNTYELSVYQCSNDEAAQRNHGNAHVVSIGLGGTTIYDPSTNVGTPALPGAGGAETIDTDDMTLSSDGTYLFVGPGATPTQYITFDTTLQAEKWYEVTVTFADGSELTQSFIAEEASADGDSSGDASSGELASTDTSSASSSEVAPAAEDPIFVINSSGTITADDSEEVSIEVDGSEIYSSGKKEISVQVELGSVQADGTITYSQLYSWADVDGGESYSTGSGSGSSYVLRATAVISSTNTVQYASTNRVQVKTLVDGDQAPELPTRSASFANFLNNYINPSSNLVKLDSNQVLMLFELDADITANPVNPDIDFDDLAVVLTFDREDADVQYKQVGDQLRFLEKK